MRKKTSLKVLKAKATINAIKATAEQPPEWTKDNTEMVKAMAEPDSAEVIKTLHERNAALGERFDKEVARYKDKIICTKVIVVVLLVFIVWVCLGKTKP
jgi:hypothetical protein